MSKPSQVIIAIRIMWAVLIAGVLKLLGLSAVVIYKSESIKLIELIPILGMIVLFGLFALLIRAVSAGRNWARFVYSTVAIFGVLLDVYTMTSEKFDLTIGPLRLILSAAYMIVLYLLYHQATNKWFKNPDMAVKG